VVGVDIFVESSLSPEALGKSLEYLAVETPARLKMISNRGTKVYPSTGAITDCVDHWRCRFVVREAGADLADAAVLDLLQRIAVEHRWMHLEKLQEFDQVSGFTMAQGED
jgi:isocitrate dehydrogenase